MPLTMDRQRAAKRRMFLCVRIINDSLASMKQMMITKKHLEVVTSHSLILDEFNNQAKLIIYIEKPLNSGYTGYLSLYFISPPRPYQIFLLWPFVRTIYFLPIDLHTFQGAPSNAHQTASYEKVAAIFPSIRIFEFKYCIPVTHGTTNHKQRKIVDFSVGNEPICCF